MTQLFWWLRINIICKQLVEMFIMRRSWLIKSNCKVYFFVRNQPTTPRWRLYPPPSLLMRRASPPKTSFSKPSARWTERSVKQTETSRNSRKNRQTAAALSFTFFFPLFFRIFFFIFHIFRKEWDPLSLLMDFLNLQLFFASDSLIIMFYQYQNNELKER